MPIVVSSTNLGQYASNILPTFYDLFSTKGALGRKRFIITKVALQVCNEEFPFASLIVSGFENTHPEQDLVKWKTSVFAYSFFLLNYQCNALLKINVH